MQGQRTQRLNRHRRRIDHDPGRVDLDDAGTDSENNLQFGGHRDRSARINRLIQHHRNVLPSQFDIEFVVAAL